MVTVNNSDYYNNIPAGRDLNKLPKLECDQWMTESMNRCKKWLNKILYENLKLLEVDLWESLFQI